MFEITLIAMGKLKEKFYLSAAQEYTKRLSGYCRFQLLELPECRLPDTPSDAEIAAGLEKEADLILAKLPKGAWFCVFTPEGKLLSSEALADKIKEVIDGQQRLLTILGFLGKTYVDERGNVANSNKDKFKLTKLKILEELDGKNIDTISKEFEDKILEFPIDVIEIDSEMNPEFSPIDLFLRLNSKPYPIKENTFEMWNAYVDKDIIQAVKEISNKYEGKLFKNKDTRMKIEELITS